MKKILNTLGLCLCVAALAACSSARGESAGPSSLDATAEECAEKSAECAEKSEDCCAEQAEVKAMDSCCSEEKADS